MKLLVKFVYWAVHSFILSLIFGFAYCGLRFGDTGTYVDPVFMSIALVAGAWWLLLSEFMTLIIGLRQIHGELEIQLEHFNDLIQALMMHCDKLDAEDLNLLKALSSLRQEHEDTKHANDMQIDVLSGSIAKLRGAIDAIQRASRQD